MKSLTIGNPMKTLAIAFASAAAGVLLGMSLVAPFPIAADGDGDDGPRIVTVVEQPRIFHLVDSNGVPGKFTLFNNSGHWVLMLTPEAPAPVYFPINAENSGD